MGTTINQIGEVNIKMSPGMKSCDFKEVIHSFFRLFLLSVLLKHEPRKNVGGNLLA